MEKKNCSVPLTGNFKKLLLIMKLCVLFLLVSTATLMASSGYSQNARLSVHLENVTLKELITHIESQTEFIFVLLEGVVDLNKEITVDVQDQTIDKILDKVFESSANSYKIFDRQIAIGKKEIVRQLEGLRAEVNLEVEQPQKKEISGTVKDVKGNPLPGVSVVLKGTLTGTVTDASGNYTFQVPLDARTLIFSFVGMKSQEIQIGNKTVIHVVLAEETMGIEEVVAVGYGTQVRREIIGSISSVRAEELENSIVPSFESALQGRATGVQVTQSNGSPGSTVLVRVRGIGSISGNTDPLYVVDGIPIISGAFNNPQGVGFESEVNVMSDINPVDIESIEILKDASAAAIYGARAGNGVVLINTKRGKTGKTKISANVYYGVSQETNRLKFLNGKEWLDIVQEGWVNEGRTGDAPLPLIYPSYDLSVARNTNVDYLDEVLRKGSVSDYNVSASGGNEKTTFYIGGGYRNDKGILINNDWERYSGKISVENKISQKLVAGGNLNMSYVNNSRLSGGYENTSGLGGFNAAVTYGIPVIPIYELDGSGEYFNAKGYQGNALAGSDANLNKFRNQVYRTFGNVYAQWSILPALNFRSEFGIDNLTQIDNNFQSRKVRTNNLSKAEDHRLLVISYTNNNTLTYLKTFSDVHYFSAMVGMSFQRSIKSSNGLGRENFPYDNLEVPSAASTMLFSYSDKSEFAFISYFTRINYSLNKKYLLGLSIRTDGSSRFGENNHYGQFPSGSAGWIISDESFMKDVKFINFLKLKTSYGQTGNAEIGNFQSFGLYRTGFNYNNFPGTMPDRIPNPDLRWEKQNMFDVGIDYGFFDNRISGSIIVYDKVSKDMLLTFPGPTSAGLQTSSITMNAGSLRNRGIEFSFSSKNLVGNFKWNTDLNITHNRSKVLDLAGLKPDQVTGGNYIQTFEGKRLGTFMLIESLGIDPNTGFEMVDSVGVAVPMREIEKNQNVALSLRKPMYDKPAEPLFYGGITNSFMYKGFDLSVLFTFNYGNYILDIGERNSMELDKSNTRNYRTEILDRWQKPGDKTKVPKVYYEGPANRDRFYTTRWLHDASYLRLKTLTFGYSLSKNIARKLYADEVRIYMMAQNLLTFTKFPGWDPEVVSVSMSTDQNNYQGKNLSYATANNSIPQIRTITFGLNLNF